MSFRRVHLRIHGLVQGVSYRATARDVATRLGLVGWVKNLPNGDVESMAEGDTAAVDAFVTWCRRGPEEARVDQVDVREDTARGEWSSFAVVR